MPAGLKVLNLGVELPEDGILPKNAGARSIYVRGAFVCVMNEQFNTFYIYCSVHRNILWNDQQMEQ